jgi:hypothetical protein
MSSVVISGDTSGAITLSAPAVAGTNTITLPAATGTVMVSGNMPAFSAYIASNFSLTNLAWTKVAFDTKSFDTASCYDNATNYRFTPNVAGYYQFNISIGFNSNQSTEVAIALYKNGSACSYLLDYRMTSFANGSCSALFYANGTTDYFETYVYQSSGGATLIIGGTPQSSFQACLVRSA